MDADFVPVEHSHGSELELLQINMLRLPLLLQLSLVLFEFLARTPFVAGDEGALLEFVPSVLVLECVYCVLGFHTCVSQRHRVRIISLRFGT